MSAPSLIPPLCRGFLVAFAVCLWAAVNAPPADAQGVLPSTLAAAIEATEEAFPGLLELSERPQGRVLTGVDDEAIAGIKSELAGGTLRPESAVALRVVFLGLSQRTGAPGVEGRNLLQDVAGIAAESGSVTAIRGVSELLYEIMDDLAHPYGLLAQEMLSEKIRCGAASAGEDDLIREISERINPDREARTLSRGSNAADRYGLHQSADLYSVAVQGQRVAAVGNMGTLLISLDGGTTWNAPDTGTDEPLYAVTINPDGAIWAAGRLGTVLLSKDGREVSARPTPFDRHFFGIVAPRPGAVRVVGDFGLQLSSEDDGASWRCVPREGDVILGRIARAGDDAAVAGEFATIERLPRANLPGVRSQVSGVPEDFYLFDIWFDESGGRGLAVGLAGTLLASEDGGATWVPAPSSVTADLYGVGGSGNRVALVGEGGTIALSDDGGRSFKPWRFPFPPFPFHDVAFANPDRGFVVGPRGLIARLSGDRLDVVHPAPAAEAR